MKEESEDKGNDSDQFNDENNLNQDNNFELVKPGQINNFTNILKKLVKYDRDLFDIFSKVKIRNNSDDMQQMLGNFTSLLNEKNDSDSKGKEHDQSNAPKIAEKNTSTVEEKIDYIMGDYEKSSAFADMRMSGDTGCSFSLIFALVSEIAKGENNFECELGTALVFESMREKELMKTKEKLTPEREKKIGDIVLNFYVSISNLFAFESKQNILCVINQSNKEEVLFQLRERVQNYKTAKENLKKLLNDALAQIKKVLGIPNENNKDNLNLNFDIKKDKDEQFAIKRASWGYMGSFLKNILLDLTLINPIRKIFFLNKIKGQIQSLKTEQIQSLKTKIANKVKQSKEEQQSTEELNQLKQEGLLGLVEDISKTPVKIIEETFSNVLERISKKNNPWLLILDVVVCTSLILFVCSLIFAWGTILNYIFLAALLASIVYKGIKKYRQERRKDLATKASQYLNKPPQNFIYYVFDHIQQNMNTRKQEVLLHINSQIEQFENNIRETEQIGNNIGNEEKPENEIEEEEIK